MSNLKECKFAHFHIQSQSLLSGGAPIQGPAQHLRAGTFRRVGLGHSASAESFSRDTVRTTCDLPGRAESRRWLATHVPSFHLTRSGRY